MDNYLFLKNLFPNFLIIVAASFIFISTSMKDYIVANPSFNPNGGFDLQYGVVDPIMKRNAKEWYEAEIQKNPLPYGYTHQEELNAIPTDWGFI